MADLNALLAPQQPRIDTSMYSTIKTPEPVNPLASLGQFATVRNEMDRNALLQQSLKNEQLNNERGQVGLRADQQKLSTTQNDAIARLALQQSWLPDNQQTPDAYRALVSRAQQQGLIDDKTATLWASNIPDGATPQQLRTMANVHGMSMLSPDIAAKLQAPQAGNPLSLGNVVQPTTNGAIINPTGGINPAANTPAPAGPAYQMGMSPSEAAHPIDRTGSDGKPYKQPLGGFAQESGIGGRGAGGPPAASPVPNNGRISAPPAQNFGKVADGPSPQESLALKGEAEGATAAGQKVYDASDTARTQKTQLDNMAAELTRIRSTGPGTEREKMVNAFMQKFGGFGVSMTPDELASAESFAKIAKQIAMAQAGAMGAGTDEKLMTAMGANPNLDLSKKGNAQIIGMLKGNADAIMAKADAWNAWRKSGKGPDTYNQFQTQFNKEFDPMVYQWKNMYPLMSPAERKAHLDSLPDKGASLKENYNKVFGKPKTNG